MKPYLLAGFFASSLALSVLAVAPPPRMSAPPIDDLIRQLGADTFAERETAMRSLEGRDDALPVLQEAMKSTDAEVRLRARRLVRSIRSLVAQRRLAEAHALLTSGDVDQAVVLLVEWSDYDTTGQFLEPLFRLVREVLRRERKQYGKTKINSAVVKRFATVQGYLSAQPLQWFSSKQRLTLGGLLGVVRAQSLDLSGDGGHSADASVIVCDGKVTGEGFFNTVVIANGPVDAKGAANCVIICDDAIDFRRAGASNCLVIARGSVRCDSISQSSVFSGGIVTTNDQPDSVVREKQTTFPFGIRFFELERVGLDVEDTKEGSLIRAILPDKVLSSCPLRAKDLITAVGSEKIISKQQLRRLFRSALADRRKLSVTVKRGTEVIKLEIAG